MFHVNAAGQDRKTKTARP